MRYIQNHGQRQIQGGERPSPLSPIFWKSLVIFSFYNPFKELHIVLLEIELIINNAPLTYVWLNTIETCLTPNHLLFGIQLLYSSNTKSTIIFWIGGDINM